MELWVNIISGGNAICWERVELWVNIISLIIQDGGTWTAFSPDQGLYLAVLKQYEIITLQYNEKACRLDLICF